MRESDVGPACGVPVSVIDAFASPADCRRLVGEAERGAWIRSAVERKDSWDHGYSGRTSDSLFLPGGFSAWAATWLHRAEEQLAELLGIRPQCLEPWQMTRYRRGTAYDYHLDCGAWAGHPSGERARTVMLVLEAPQQGGATHFRALARTVRPAAGRLVVWRNLLPDGGCNHAMIHAGRPVWQGRKTILTTWERQRPYVEAST